MEAYCVKRRSKREMGNAQAITMKNGRPATQGVCPACSTKMFRPSLHRVPERRVRAATAVSGSAIDTLAANGVKRIYSVRKNLSVKFLILSRLVELRGLRFSYEIAGISPSFPH